MRNITQKHIEIANKIIAKQSAHMQLYYDISEAKRRKEELEFVVKLLDALFDDLKILKKQRNLI